MTKNAIVLNGFAANYPWVSFEVFVTNYTTSSVSLNINILSGSGISILQFGLIMTNNIMESYIHIDSLCISFLT